MTNITSRTKSAAIISAFGVAAFVCFQNFTSAVAVKGATPPTLTSRNLPSSFWGINIENVYGENFTWASKVASAAISSTGMHLLRFPGGDAGNYYDWQTGLFWPSYSNDETPGSPADTLTDLVSLSKATNTSPLYNLNVMTSDNSILTYSPSNIATPAVFEKAITYQIQMLKAAEGFGLPVKYLELGNEFFWGTADQTAAFASAIDYAKGMAIWAPALKKAFPGVSVAAVGAIPYGPDSGLTDARMATWNSQMLPDLKDVDAITIHRYDNIVDGGVWDPQTAEQTLSFVFNDWSLIKKQEVESFAARGLKTWVTEFGGFQDCTANNRLSGTWVEGLYQAEMALQFLKEPNVTQIQLYNLTGGTSSLYFQDSPSYWNTCSNTSFNFNGTPGELTATGQAYALLGRTLTGATTVAGLNLSVPRFTPPTPAGGWDVSAYPSADGIFVSESGLNQWVFINFVSEPLTLHYSGMGAGKMESLSAPSLTTLVTSQTSLKQSVQSFNGANFVLPPFSINRIWVVK